MSTRDKWDEQFQMMLERGFQPSEVASLYDDGPPLVVRETEDGRKFVVIQLEYGLSPDPLIREEQLKRGPQWKILSRSRVGLKCFLLSPIPERFTRIKCIRRFSKSALVAAVRE